MPEAETNEDLESSVEDLGDVNKEGEEIFNMSDDQLEDYFTKASNTPMEDTNETDQTTITESIQETEDEGESESGSSLETDGEDSAGSEEGGDSQEEETSDAVDTDSDSGLDDSAQDDDAETSDDVKDDDKATDEDDTPNTDVDASSELKRALAPLKAIGKTVNVKTIDDLRTLAQMGIGYNKKMAGLKPSLKLVKMLEQNDLLDETKLSHLIDISKKDPNAISKFLKDSDIDPMDLDSEAEGSKNYQPKDYKVNDSQIELDQVLDDIRDNDSFAKTIDTISNKWDEQSRGIILNDPKIITAIDDHVQAGIFDKIVSTMESERMMGRLNGLSDIVAYKQIGDAMQKAGAFDVPNQSTQQSAEEIETKQVVAKKRIDKRKAAAPTKGSTKQVNKADMNPLNMSDEDFDKLSLEDLYT